MVINGTPGSAMKVAPSLSSDTSLSAWSYTDGGGSHNVTAGGSYSVANAYSTVASLSFVPTPTDAGASVARLSGSGLSVGANTYTIRVFAADGSHADYSITLIRAAGGGH